MRHSVAVLSTDTAILPRLKAVLSEFGISQLTCHSCQEAMELVTKGRCSTLIVDFDLPGAQEVVKMGAVLQPPQKPVLLAVASRAWPGTGHAFQSGADRILYKPLDPAQVKEALQASQQLLAKNRRKEPRHEMQTVVYFELDTGTLPAIGIDISERGFAVQATEPVPMLAKLAFRCVLPRDNLHAARPRRRRLGQRSGTRRTLLLRAGAVRAKTSEAVASQAQRPAP